ncbi:MAG: hypothetical protein IPF68_20365 [Bacteroidales bacterium]|nr:hypothetical protein [Bacteroidales bacterium]
MCSYTATGNEFDPTNVVENCPVTPEQQLHRRFYLAGAVFPLGLTNVRWVLMDAGMNSTECYIDITIVDNQAPVITTCAPAQTASAGASCQAAVPDLTGLIALTDNCTQNGDFTITQSPAAGTLAGVGVTNITITATDEEGNSITCNTSFTVSTILHRCLLIVHPIRWSYPCNPSTLPDASMAITEAGTVTDNCGTPSANCRRWAYNQYRLYLYANLDCYCFGWIQHSKLSGYL